MSEANGDDLEPVGGATEPLDEPSARAAARPPRESAPLGWKVAAGAGPLAGFAAGLAAPDPIGLVRESIAAMMGPAGALVAVSLCLVLVGLFLLRVVREHREERCRVERATSARERLAASALAAERAEVRRLNEERVTRMEALSRDSLDVLRQFAEELKRGSCDDDREGS